MENTKKTITKRLTSLDALRGLIMILMALDHASFFIARVHPGEFWGRPLPDYTSILPFLTRFVTHICAPGFFFLMGVGMVLFAVSRSRLGWSQGRITRFFAIRGLLLIVLNHFLENPAWFLGIIGAKTESLTYGVTGPPGSGEMVGLAFTVLFALGASMIVSALVLRFNSAILVGLALAAILMTQVLTPSVANVDTPYSLIPRLLLIPGQTGLVLVVYPVIPWLGITLLGLVFGKALLHDRARTFRWSWMTGIAFLLIFLVLRFAGGFGNFHPPGSGDWMTFFNVTKYPPSLTFLFLTLGVNLLILVLFSRCGKLVNRWGSPLLVFGRTALFFYFVHLYLYAFIGFGFPNGTSHPMMLAVWLLGLVFLYPVCYVYARFKQRASPNSFWRFF